VVIRSPSRLPPFRQKDSQRVLVSYAQVGEDVRLARVLWDRNPGFYVDVGAGDPISDSVTKLFYDAGWRGINVEPGPAYDRLASERTRDVNLRIAVARVNGERTLWVTQPDTGLSSFARPADEFLPSGVELQRVRIPCRRLDAILDEHCAGSEIDFLKVDVEGAEAEVIESLDLRRFRPLVLVVEAIRPLTYEATHEQWEPRVLEADYVFAAFDGVNRFYVPREHDELREVLDYPLSLLDHFVHQREVEGSLPDPSEDSRFPHLGVQLRARPEAAESAIAPLVVFAGKAVDADRLQVELPTGSVVATRSGRMLRTRRVGEAHADHPTPTHGPLEALVQIVRSHAGDLLLVSDERTMVTDELLRELRSALSEDSACTTVSVEPGAGRVAPGLPPPGARAPRRGIVLVRRTDLLLAAEEAELTAPLVRTPARGGGLASDVLALLDRPGFVHRSLSASTTAPRSPSSARLSVRRGQQPRVLIDGRCFAHPMAGTQVQVLGFVSALARSDADAALLVPSAIHPSVRPEVDRLGTSLRLVDRPVYPRPEVFHRPFQVGSLDVLIDCLSLGERFVLTHQDMILDRTPSYHVDEGAWADYRNATSAALSSADAVGFFSLHAAIDAASDGELHLERATVVPLGVDHLAGREAQAAPAAPLGDRPYLLVVGSSFWHKNRPFAIRLLRWLIEQRGWDGGLVLAGSHMGCGSSVEAERRLIHESGLDDRVLDLGHVAEPEQLALYRDAELVLFPSLYEGFGFIPFEAAALGTACVYANRSSMAEMLPASGTLASFELEETGPFVARLLADPSARGRIVADIREAASSLTWDRTAAGYLEVYRRAVSGEPSRVSRSLLRAARRETVVKTRSEAMLLDVYRRRSAFRVVADSSIRAGLVIKGTARRALDSIRSR
jgi:FkbM family methyltransferase